MTFEYRINVRGFLLLYHAQLFCDSLISDESQSLTFIICISKLYAVEIVSLLNPAFNTIRSSRLHVWLPFDIQI